MNKLGEILFGVVVWLIVAGGIIGIGLGIPFGIYYGWEKLENTLLAPPIEPTHASWGDRALFFATPDYVEILNTSDKTLRFRTEISNYWKSEYKYISPRATERILIGKGNKVVVYVDGYWSDLIITIDRKNDKWSWGFD